MQHPSSVSPGRALRQHVGSQQAHNNYAAPTSKQVIEPSLEACNDSDCDAYCLRNGYSLGLCDPGCSCYG